jgi:meiotic recombination protein SPO11
MTKAFLRRICSLNMANVPTYGLVDYDVDGVGILSNYGYGSATMAHEALDLPCPLRWVGLKSSDVIHAATRDRGGAALMPLSRRDRRRATLMLARRPLCEGADGAPQEPEWRRELQVMLLLNVKAEMQLLESSERGGLGAWVGRRVRGNKAAES